MSVVQVSKNIIRENIYPVIFNAISRVVNFSNSLQVERIHQLKKMLRERPLLLAIETVSACNASCIFCPYSTMKRAREVMEPKIFEKIVREYSQMGGGAISLTPVMGDLFLDTHLLQRFEVLERYPNINQITFTTNGIAFEKFSNDDLRYLLERTYLVQFSIGGLDKQTYKKLYRVDKFDKVFEAVERTIAIRDSIKSDLIPLSWGRLPIEGEQKRFYGHARGAPEIILAFRTNNHNFLIDFADELNRFRKRGVLVSHISVYNNFSGEIKTDEIRIKKNRVFLKKMVCVLPLLNPHVCSNGQITNCGCGDIEGKGLIIGDVSLNSLKEVWQGIRREKILNLFSEGKLPQLCQNCTAYRPVTYLGSDVFKNVKPNALLPLEIYLNLLGG